MAIVWNWADGGTLLQETGRKGSNMTFWGSYNIASDKETSWLLNFWGENEKFQLGITLMMQGLCCSMYILQTEYIYASKAKLPTWKGTQTH